MKFVVILLLVAAVRAGDVPSQNNGDQNAEKRSQKTVSVDKRAPVISTVSPAITPGIEYADSKESQQDKSPTHQIYATPLPPVSKISDVLTGQGPAFQSAIASHLYAPVSVYQPRLGSATTYEVSAPVSSNLAYAEHRVSLQPQQNALQYSQKPSQKPKNVQQVLVQQPLEYQQTLGPVGQPVYQQIPQLQYQDFAINQFQVPLYPGQQPLYQGQPVQIAQLVQPSPSYSPEPQQQNHQPTQRELKPQPETKTSEKQAATQNYVQPKDAISFARFSQLQPTPLPQQEVVYQLQPQPQPQPQQQLQQAQYHQPQVQYQQQLQYQQQQPQFQLLQQQQYQPAQQYQIYPQVQPAQYQYQIQPQQTQQQIQPQIQYQLQPQLLQQKLQALPLPQPQHQPMLQQYQPLPQPQYQPLPQQQIHLQPVPKATNVGKASYLRPGPAFLQSQYPQSHEAPDYRNNVALPTFPPVQYYGKYAQSIFGNLQH